MYKRKAYNLGRYSKIEDAPKVRKEAEKAIGNNSFPEYINKRKNALLCTKVLNQFSIRNLRKI